jgi:geranylgeranyl diphosphate synthase type I
VFEEMRLEVNMGQYLDVLGAAQGREADPLLAEERSRLIRRYKTAKYTIERPLQLGAALADPDRANELMEPLSRFGVPLGEAFQLRDDLLGVFGDPDLTGKPVGEDLREGKATMLANLALERDPGGGTTILGRRFGSPDLTDQEVAEMQGIIEATGAKAQVEDTIADLLDQSAKAMADLALTGEALAALEDLANFVAGRDH